MSISDLIKVSAASREQKQNELLELAKSGVTLPMAIADIIEIEQRGDVVDLNTGEVIKGGATQRFSATEAATEAVGGVRKSVFKR